MDDKRKKPEEILARLKEQESSFGKGRLKIFLGMAAGVGKTYTMLEAAQTLRKDGVDVVAGVVVTHGRKDTEALLTGLELLELKTIEYKGGSFTELDTDAVLKRKPSVVLVDELAHSNVPGSRHEKRFQDVQEILKAGIDVFTTLNIQHIESVNDLVAQSTGVKVRETVPDSVFDTAYEIELVDLPPDDLIQRLQEGKIYIPDYAKNALGNFFKKGNLIALRELALRVTADRVDAQMLRYRQEQNEKDVWPVADKILVCVGPSPLSLRLVRAAKRMATRLNAEWFAVYVETPSAARLPESDRNRMVRTLALAQRLGAQTDRISGHVPSESLVAYAQRLNVTKIVIGKPARPRWREIFFGSVVDEVIRRSGNIDVYVISGEKGEHDTKVNQPQLASPRFTNYLYAIVFVGLATMLSRLTAPYLAPVNLAMIYLLAIVVIALRYGRGAAMFSSVISVLAFDFFFVPPYLSFSVSDTQYVFTFIVMFVVALAVSSLTSTVKLQAELAGQRERQTAALYRLTREQAKAMGAENVVAISVKHIIEVFECKAAVALADSEGRLSVVAHNSPTFDVDAKEMGVVQWVFVNNQPAGATTSTLAGAKALYLPLVGSAGIIGVIGIMPNFPDRLGNPDEMHLLETFVNQMALAVERAQLGERRKASRDQSKASTGETTS
jgi:two-component system sensor histidine kinase KdpD